MAKTAYRKPKKKVHVFDIVNYIVFILIGLLVLVPIWKVVVDSFNAVGVYQFRLWPEDFTLDGLGGKDHRDGSLAYYFSEPVVCNDAKGVGPLVLAYTEMIARKN